MKKCRKCLAEKPDTDFHKTAKSKDGLAIYCKTCKSEIAKEYNAKNSDHIKEKCKRYYQANSEAIKEQARIYISENRDEINKRKREHYRENRERLLIVAKAYQQKNSERIRDSRRKYWVATKEKRLAYRKKYCAENKEAVSALKRNRRAKIRGAEGSHTAEEIASIFSKQKGLCASCSKKLFKSGEKKYHVDHIKPLSKGGSNAKENLQCLCKDCNLRKHAKDPFDWAKQNGKLL